ncbi:hypothetical protein [Nocardia grenadensis]|uniref:hypothetical protein n=1 Tax=Nocardia grenadensis TaxID=931537 RepID=UPI003D8CA3A9
MDAGAIRSRLLRLLTQAGIQVVGGTSDRLFLRGPHSLQAIESIVQMSDHRLTGHQIKRDQDRSNRRLYAAPEASRSVIERALADELDLVTTDPPLVIFNTEIMFEDRDSDGRPGHRTRTAWARWSLTRTLATSQQPRSQTELAELLGFSQQAISHALRSLTSTHKDEAGWLGNSVELLDAWLDEYPGPGGTIQGWYDLDDPATQAQSATSLLTELELTPVVSGDLAADEYSPWQIPATALLYLPEIIDFSPVGFTPVDVGDATMLTVVPDDPTIQRTAHRALRQGQLLADPAIVLWDLLHTSVGPNATETAQRLRHHIVNRQLDA